LYIVFGDEFDLNWAKSVEENMKRTLLEAFGVFKNINTFHVLKASIVEMKKIQNQEVHVELNDSIENDMSNLDIVQFKEKVAETRVDCEEIKKMFNEIIGVHLIWAKSYFTE